MTLKYKTERERERDDKKRERDDKKTLLPCMIKTRR